MPEPTDTNLAIHDTVLRRLTPLGQRYTQGRRQLVEVLAASPRPLSMVEILEGVPGIPQSSAYRHLTVLTSVGVVHRIAGTDDLGYFELSDELSGDHHHHVLCSTCGRVDDVEASPRLEQALADAAALAAEATGFDLSHHRIDLFGTCPNCQSQAD